MSIAESISSSIRFGKYTNQAAVNWLLGRIFERSINAPFPSVSSVWLLFCLCGKVKKKKNATLIKIRWKLLFKAKILFLLKDLDSYFCFYILNLHWNTHHINFNRKLNMHFFFQVQFSERFFLVLLQILFHFFWIWIWLQYEWFNFFYLWVKLSKSIIPFFYSS